MKHEYTCLPPHGQPQWPEKQPTKRREAIAFVLILAFLFAMLGLFGYLSYKAIPPQYKHVIGAIPAGKYRHVAGLYEYQQFTKNNH